MIFDVMTGQSQLEFAPHGHVVLVRAAGLDVERVITGRLGRR